MPKTSDLFRAGLLGSCELQDVGAEPQTQILCKSSIVS